MENISYSRENYELYSTSVEKLFPPSPSPSKQPAPDQGMQSVINSLWIQWTANDTQTQKFSQAWSSEFGNTIICISFY